MDDNLKARIRATTILAVRKDGRSVMAGDGQVSLGETIMKQKAEKVRFLYKGAVLVGFAGAAADAFSLFERLEGKAGEIQGEPHPGCGGAGQGLADRPDPAKAGGADPGHGPGAHADHLRHRGRDRTGRRWRPSDPADPMPWPRPRLLARTPVWMPRRSPVEAMRSPPPSAFTRTIRS